MLLFCMNAIHLLSFCQDGYTFSGRVSDEYDQPLPGVAVILFPYLKGTITDSRGEFFINDLKKGTYRIEFSFIGYKKLVDTIEIPVNHFYDTKLLVDIQKLDDVVIRDNYAATQKKENSLNVEIVNSGYLKQNFGGSIMKSLERLPGISTIDIGSGQAKPVIRGLSFNRIVAVENGIKHESQQWGSDHGLEIDQYAIDNIEVIKGPASLMYGSDAIGGAIDMKSRTLPVENSIGGTIDLCGKSNNSYLGTSVSLYGRTKWLFVNLRATLAGYADYKVPADSVDIYSYRAALYKNHMRNTAGTEQNLHLTFGIIQKTFQSRFYISNVNSKSGFFANAHGLEPRNVDSDLHDQSGRDINYPYQQVNHFKIINTSQYTRDKIILESGFGFQRNYRQEWSQYISHGYMPAIFPDTLSFNPALEHQFDKFIYSGNLKLSYNKNDKTHFIYGVNSDYQDNRIGGRAFIIPAFRQFNLGGYIFYKHAFSTKSIIQMGVRYDFGNVKTNEYYDWVPSPVVLKNDTTLQYLKRADNVIRSFSNISWSAGYNYNPGEWSFKINLGKSFRMPIAKELAANGVNYHHYSYETGNSALSPEISYQLDAGIENETERFSFGFTPFLNYFTNYIYLNPSSDHDRLYGNGNQVFYYTECEVFRFGAEIHAYYQVLKPLQIGVTGEYVYSEQLSGKKKGFTLPFSPPASAILNVKCQKLKIKYLENAYLSVDYKLTASQKNIVPPEEETDGYQIVNIGSGGDVNLKNHKVRISLQIQNLFNTKYFNHTSYYRLINVPEPGRNFIMNISIPFSGKIKQK